MPLPTWIQLPDTSTGVPSRSDLSDVASNPTDQQLTVAAENAPLRIIYGRARVGAQIANVLIYNGYLVMQCVWGEGEIDSIESVTMNNEAITTGVTATHYLGASSQTVDATMVAAFASIGITYTDNLDGIAYSVFQIMPWASDGFPSFEAIIKGRKVYDPRGTPATVWSDNPALCLGDFIESTAYGLGRTIDDTSLGDAADECDELVGDLKRRLIGLVIDWTQPTRQHIEALRAYAGCWVVDTGDGLKLIPDRPRATDHTVTASDIVAGSLRLRRLGVLDVPTVIRVRYTDTSILPWSEKEAIAKANGVDAGTTPRRESDVPLPGIQRYSQAYREAVERINHFNLEDLEAEWDQFDEALAIEPGDVVSLTHPVGLSSKLMRVTSAKARTPGRWHIIAREYDSAAYSDAIEGEPTWGDTTLPSPSAPPELAGLAAVEEVYQLENGTYSSRLLVTWTDPGFAYLRDYRIEVFVLGDLIVTGTAREPVFRTPAVQQGVEYVVKVAAVSSIGTVGDWAQVNIIAAGKALIPGNVPSVSTFEVGGTVYVTWQPAVDIDIWRYEVRYGTTSDTWDDATLVDRVDALRLTTNMLAVGTWRMFVKALDSVGQYSTNAAYDDVTVTSDASSFLVGEYNSTSPTLTNMVAFTLAPTDTNTYYVTDDGDTFATNFGSTLDTYTNALATYHGSVTSTWLGESEDFGQSLSGQWTGEATVEDLSGTHESYLGVSADGSTWDYLEDLSQKTTARFALLKHEALTTSTMLVTVPTQKIRIDAVPREEVGIATSSASAATLIELGNNYSAVKRILLTPESTAARIATYDRVLVAPEDGLCLYDTSDGGGNSDVQHTISTSARVILSDDYLEYDVFVHQRPDGTFTYGIGGMRIRFSDATFSTSSEVDELGHTLDNPIINYGKWKSRKIALSGLAGKTSSHWLLRRVQDSAGDYKAVYRNIRITDGAGTTRLQLWESGEPSANSTLSSLLSSNIQCGPANSFNVYVFDAAGTQVANDFSWVFQGV